MYKCNSCRREFDHYKTLKEPTGEKIYVCPFCKDTDFDEIQVREDNDNYLIINKSDVIDFVVAAIGYINREEPEIAKDSLIELIKEMVDDTFFDYKDKLNTVSDIDSVNSLINELKEILQVVIA